MFGGFKGIITEITQSNLIKNTKAESILELETTNVGEKKMLAQW